MYCCAFLSRLSTVILASGEVGDIIDVHEWEGTAKQLLSNLINSPDGSVEDLEGEAYLLGRGYDGGEKGLNGR